MSGIIDGIREVTGGKAEALELIREKQGVHVYRCRYEGERAVVKYFENEGDRREIANYRLLQRIDVPTVKTLSIGGTHIVMEDIAFSGTWRMGEVGDLNDPRVLRALAKWYFALHEGGEGHEEIQGLYSENDELSIASIDVIRGSLPGAEELCRFAETNLQAFRSMLRDKENTLTYNDFYYTNLIVRRDLKEAMMIDYNLTGRGYRYADFRNIASSVCGEAFAAFREEYGRLYLEKYGREFAENETERRLDDFLSPLLGLVSALKRENFPAWAERMKEDAQNGTLLALGKELFDYAD